MSAGISDAPSYAELAAASHFSFLRGASAPTDLVATALALGHAGLGIADRNTVAGVVRAFAALRAFREGAAPVRRVRLGSSPGEMEVEPALPVGPSHAELCRRAHGFKLAVGARLAFADGTPDIVAYPRHRAGWGALCRLLTTGNRRARKGECDLALDDLLGAAQGLLLVVRPDRDLAPLAGLLPRLAEAAPGAVWLGAALHLRGDDRRRLAALKAEAEAARVPLLALNDVLYAAPEDRDLQDVVTCVREGVAIAQAGRRLQANAERHLKAPGEMARLFRDAPQALNETGRLLAQVDFCLSELKYDYPDEPVPEGWCAQDWLAAETWRGAAKHYPKGVPDKVAGLLKAELALIAKLDYARYFLTILDIVRFAEGAGILCQGRGSAANSAVCFVLGITAVDPAENDVLFARFISEERREPPDIDVDFEHERREEVIQYIYGKYGRHRAGIAATVISYRPRSAIRDVGKALGLTEDITARIASTQWGSYGEAIPDTHIAQAGLDPANPMIRRAVAFATRLLGAPRHLSQHVGGFILTRGRLDETVPIGNAAMADRTFIEWDKDDIDTLGLLKVDVLALGMLTCIRKAFDLLEEHEGRAVGLADLPGEDPEVYDMLCRGDSIGVFQVESRAQMNMLPRLKPRTFYDLVIQVAIVRPGPIQGDMVHPYLRRRSGKEKVEFPAPAPAHGPADELHQVLHKTMGVPLFQEQAMRLAMVAARFSDVEANALRRAMATFRNLGTIHQFESLMVGRMVARGYTEDFARRCFEQIKGFGSYGFPESHAASFAKLVYVSAFIKCHHPAVFACALLNSQPMGFYAPAQIVRDAREHGVRVRPVDVAHSRWDSTLERDADGALALRLGLRQIDGFQEAWAGRIAAARAGQAGRGEHQAAPRDGAARLERFARRAELPARALALLAEADAFRSLSLDRRAASWVVRGLPDDAPLPLFAAADARETGAEAAAALPAMSLGEHVVEDYRSARLSLKAHPMALLRPLYDRETVLTCEGTSALRDGDFARTAGVVLVRQRPGNGKAIFITLEDETGVTNVVLWARTFERFRREVMGARLLLVEGVVQKSEEGVVHLMARRLTDRSADLAYLGAPRPPVIETARADEFRRPQYPRARHPREVRILPKSRDFH
ncbi:error-prone DNA polymerase [Xanthobacter tagetidis]|uniref:Error-prone DNA polymerase n=1 Tax=Xanthobacter tagetidis TaxID=60216 RepID=A0A3L7A274_9HYPH|nr:error-prone DNA polymerase [Xanthobacter tagetidis]MBB6307738.1 error-prone DNA polymerase [Xanthobacter tagetidis]RLP74406.1 DNA polymerase III subunit alpha [Xanthobacter tagetidis]